MSTLSAPSSGGVARLTVRGLGKTFGSVRVLRDVNLSVQPGEIHGLVGQNGSGKSTLIKILTGVYTPDPGAAYEVDGRAMRVPVRWREVRSAGVTVVHQDLGLLDQLTVAENICVGGFPTHRFTGRIDRTRRDRLAGLTLDRLGVDLHPQRLVGALSASEPAEVAIARAMRDHDAGSGLIILDESTRALAGDDLRRIHAMLRRIAADGSSALMISHNLIEVMEVTDRVTVLRDGEVAASGQESADLTEEAIARLMLGSDPKVAEAHTTDRPDTAWQTISVSDLSGQRVRDVNFTLGEGEILGITGLPGNGYEEIPYLLTGAKEAVSGTIRTPERTISLPEADVAACIEAGSFSSPSAGTEMVSRSTCRCVTT